MSGTAIALYRAAFVARHTRQPADRSAVVAEPGVCGVVSPDEERTIRLLVVDDRAFDRLAADVPAARRGSVSVFDTAPRCDELLRGQPGWHADRPATAMVRRDLHAVPDPALPDGLAVRAVNRLPSDAADGVPLDEAAAVAIASDPGIAAPADAFAAFLRALPPPVRLFAAVDAGGAARATSGMDVFGEETRIFFVNTAPGWRGRGIGAAMTVEALRAAARSGARRASLDATDAAASLYRRLGFEAAGRLSRYTRAG